jgi:hypothetical protein
MELAQEGPKPPCNRPTARCYLDANRHRYLIECMQKNKYPQELYILANSIPSGSGGAYIAEWFLVLTLAGHYVCSRAEIRSGGATVSWYVFGRV